MEVAFDGEPVPDCMVKGASWPYEVRGGEGLEGVCLWVPTTTPALLVFRECLQQQGWHEALTLQLVSAQE